jgi:hypothetical protein
MIDYTERCPHHTLTPQSAAYVLENPDAPGAWLYSVHLAVTCADCGVRFRFLGDNPLAPVTVMEAQSRRLGAFVTVTLDELGCMIAPIENEPSGGLASIAVAGRA